MNTDVAREPGVVIVGAGQAGAEAAFALRSAGYTGSIDLIGRETWPPYRRPPLSKQFIAADGAPEQLLIKPEAAYQKADIVLHTASGVSSIDRAQHQVVYANDQRLRYRTLILATGAEARRLTLPGSELAGVHVLRSIDDALALRAQFRSGQRLVIVGGGFVGLEVAALARQHGLHVSVLEAAPRLLARVVTPLLSDFYADVHRDAGVRIELGAEVRGFVGAAGQLTAVDCGGEQIAADLVLIGVGAKIADEIAAAAGLEVGQGILTDADCRTADPDIYAIGDCARSWRPYAGQHLRLESVPNAIEQARHVAQLIAGKPAPASAPPWFWSDQYDLKLQMVGISHPDDQQVVRGDPATRSFIAFYLRGGRLVAVVAVNRVAEFNVAKKLVADQAVLDPKVLVDEARALKDLQV